MKSKAKANVSASKDILEDNSEKENVDTQARERDTEGTEVLMTFQRPVLFRL